MASIDYHQLSKYYRYHEDPFAIENSITYFKGLNDQFSLLSFKKKIFFYSRISQGLKASQHYYTW